MIRFPYTQCSFSKNVFDSFTFRTKGPNRLTGTSTSRNLTHFVENMKRCKYLSNAHVLSVGETERLNPLNARDTQSPAKASVAQVCHYISVLSASAKNFDVLPFFPGSIILLCFSDDDDTGKKRVRKKLLLFGEFCEGGERTHDSRFHIFSQVFFSDTSHTVSSMS